MKLIPESSSCAARPTRRAQRAALAERIANPRKRHGVAHNAQHQLSSPFFHLVGSGCCRTLATASEVAWMGRSVAVELLPWWKNATLSALPHRLHSKRVNHWSCEQSCARHARCDTYEHDGCPLPRDPDCLGTCCTSTRAQSIWVWDVFAQARCSATRAASHRSTAAYRSG